MNKPSKQSHFPVSVIVLTLNEESNLPASLRSICSWAQQVFIVDAGSTDRTRKIEKDFGVTIVEHAFETHSTQWRWALANLPIGTEWVLALDADQRVTPELAVEICGLDPERLGTWTVFTSTAGRCSATNGSNTAATIRNTSSRCSVLARC